MNLNKIPTPYVVLAPLPGQKEKDWPEERWSEVIEWLDAQGVGSMLIAREIYMHTPDVAGLKKLVDQVSEDDLREVVPAALAAVSVGGAVFDVARAYGVNLVEIPTPAWVVTVGSVLDALAVHVDVTPLGPPTISTVLMVKNEMRVLPDTIPLVKRCADEVIVVDTGSTDGTREWLADQVGIIVLDYITEGEIESFSEIRNFGIENATGKYILWLDAPEQLLDPEGLRKAIQCETSDAYMLTAKFTTGGTLCREKVVLRPFAWFQDRVHEYIQLGGLKVETLPEAMGTMRSNSVKVGRESSFVRNVRLLKMMLDEKGPKDPNHGRYLFYMGLEHFQEERHDDAANWLYQRLEYGGWKEETFGALVTLAQISLYHWKDMGKAREIAGLMRELKPGCKEWTFAMAEASRLAGDAQGAKKWYLDTARADNGVKSTWAWGEAHGDAPYWRADQMQTIIAGVASAM